MSDNIIVLPRDDVAALMAAVADLEDAVENWDRRNTYLAAARERLLDPVIVLSRIASDIDQQVSTQ